MYKLRMTEMQKAYYLGRDEENNGGVGTHLYVELIYKGGEKEFKNALQKIIDSQPILRAKALDTFEFEVQDSLSYDIQVFQTDCNDEKVLSKIRAEYKTMKDMYSSLLGIPVAGATLPVCAFCLLSIYGKNPFLFVAAIILGIGHIGIHLNHKKEIE